MNWKNLIAWRYLKARKKDRFVNLTSRIAKFSLALAVTILIVSLSVIRGFEETILSKVLNDQGHIVIYSSEAYDPKPVLSKLPKDLTAVPVVETYAMLIRGKSAELALLRGVDEATFEKYSQETSGAIIGNRFSKHLNLKRGEKISLIVPLAAEPPVGIVPESIELEISDIVRFNLHDLNRFGIFLPIKQAQQILELGSKVHKIMCFILDPTKSSEVAEQLKKRLPDFYIYDWHEMNMLFADIMRIQRNMVIVILSAIIILGAVASACSLILLVNMKKKEISILRLLRATRSDIVSIFVKISLIISIISSIFGSIFGVLVAYNLDYIRRFIEYIVGRSLFDPEVYLLPAIPVSINIFDILIVIGGAFIFSFLSALLPAYQSGSIDVLENL